MKEFTVKDIIKGITPEYKKNERKIDDLKKNIILQSKYGTIDLVSSTFKIKRDSKSTLLYKLCKKKKDNYKWIDKYYNYYLNEKGILIRDQEQFDEEIDNIIKSDFVNNIDLEKTIITNSSCSTLKFDFNGSSYKIIADDVNYHAIYSYNSLKDKTSFKSEPLHSFDLCSFMDIEIKEDEIPDYLLESIEKNKVIKKERI